MKTLQFYVSLYTLLAVSTVVLITGYYTLHSGLVDFVTGKDGYAIQLNLGPKGKMSTNTNTKQAASTDGNAQKSVSIFCPVMTFEDAVMEQWKHFETLSSDEQLDCNVPDPYALSKQMRFHVSTQGVQVCNQMMYRILHITEAMMNGVKTEGGSAFMVGSYSHYLTVCPVIDHFNGTYNVMCPFYGPCTNISVIHKHVHFSGFVGKSTVIERTIWSQDNICISFKDAQYGNGITTFNSMSNLMAEDRKFKAYLGTLPKPRGELTGELGHCYNTRTDGGGLE